MAIHQSKQQQADRERIPPLESLDNEPQPFVVLLIEPNAGGQAQLAEDDYIEGAPEFVAEIAALSASKDLHDKKTVYRRNGVQEHLVWQSLENKLDWFALREGRLYGSKIPSTCEASSDRFNLF